MPILCESVFRASQSTLHPSVHRGLRVPTGFLCESESGSVPGSWRHLQHFFSFLMHVEHTRTFLCSEVNTHTATRT